MTAKLRAWLLLLSVFALCGLALWGVVWYRSRALTPAAMLKRLPSSDALVVYIDFAALRNAGILQMLDGAKVGEDPEYRSFVQATEFDYKQDLDAAMVAFAPSGKYMLLKGRFDWKSLNNYARSQGGSCNNSFCRMQGSTPERRISFFPLQSSLMALAVSADESAALRMNSVDSRAERVLPGAPVWLSIPPSIVHSGQSLPEGTQMFARSLERAQTVTLAFAPEGADYAARLDVRCATEDDAATLAQQLTRTTSLLRELITRENKQPNPADLSGFLTSGTFRREGARVAGYWPLSRTLLANLLNQ
ncbi:MAG: hypothetical protein JST11_18385 [Acidobacteria bacterium]|nr:hypothetical protein [Acidobacteriota bacterium]